MYEDSVELNVRFAEGGVSINESLATNQVEFLAHEFELTCYNIDCSRAKSASAIIRTIARQLDFPDHFSGQFDEFYDFLTDAILIERRGIAVILSNIHYTEPALVDIYEKINQVFTDALTFARHHQRVLIFVNQPTDHPIED